jgi:hypothetical protein
MDRRMFFGTFARGVLAAAPLIANAQQTQIRIGVDTRGAGGKAELAPTLAAELVQLKVAFAGRQSEQSAKQGRLNGMPLLVNDRLRSM